MWAGIEKGRSCRCWTSIHLLIPFSLESMCPGDLCYGRDRAQDWGHTENRKDAKAVWPIENTQTFEGDEEQQYLFKLKLE